MPPAIEPDRERRAVDAVDLRFPGCVRLPDRVEVGEHAGRGFQRIDARIGACRVRGLADDLDFEVQASVVRRGDAVGKAGGDREIRPRDTLREQPRGADIAARFLVVGEVQLDGACELRTARLQREQRIAVRREVGLRHRDAAAVHEAILDHRAVGFLGPAEPGRHDVAVRVQRDRGSRSEALAHDEVGCGEHAIGADDVGRHRMPLDRRSRALRAARPRASRGARSRPAGCRREPSPAPRGTASGHRAVPRGSPRSCGRGTPAWAVAFRRRVGNAR